ncbi:hypothetical protein BS17DRAFT_789091 [Gyrodon lividus]|nr:hypothetical protein BS17DRAFT_789091 [Gyrodon lividus]
MSPCERWPASDNNICVPDNPIQSSLIPHPIRRLYPTSHSATMIRRPPTMIPMNDADVQDIRELVAHQKAQYDQKQKTLLHMQKIAERPLAEDDPAAMAFLRQLSDRAREREERNKRLGILPG